MGDSITERVSAVGYGAGWVDVALARLRAAYPTPGVVGGFNYLPAYSAAAGFDGAPQPYAALTGGAPGAAIGRGLGNRCAIFGAVGDGVTYTGVNATSVSAMYEEAGGLGTISLQVDGAAPVTVSTAGTNGQSGLLSSGPLAAGPHTVTVTRSAGGAVYFDGLLVFNGDELAGIQGYEAGHFGFESAEMAISGDNAAPFALVAPQLVTIALGTNDYIVQVPIATYRANLQQIITGVRAQVPGVSVALVMYARRGDVAVQPIGWGQYVQACYDLADADAGGINGGSGVAVLDLSARLPNAAMIGTVDPIGVYATDRVHYSAKGHLTIGEAVAGALGM